MRSAPTPMRRLLLLTTLLLVVPLARGSAIYTYRQKDGTIVYTNVPPAGVVARKLKGTAFREAPRPTEVPQRSVISPSLHLAWMTEASRKYNIPLPLVRAVAHAESNYDPRALSRKGASGMMQLMPRTADEMYVRDIFDARENIFGGVRYLRVLANEFNGQMETMVAAYNAGPEAVRKAGGQVPPYEETRAYVTKVLSLYFQYKQEPASAGRADETAGGRASVGQARSREQAMTSQLEPSSWR